MSEIIISITEKRFGHENIEYEGYEIVTDIQTVLMGVQFIGDCYYYMSEYDFEWFIGEKLRTLDISHHTLVDRVPKDYHHVPIDIITSRRILQFVAYGRGGMVAIVISNQLNHSETL